MTTTLFAIFEGTVYFSVGILTLGIALMTLYLIVAFCIADWHKKHLNKWHNLTDKEREQYIKYKLEKAKLKYKFASANYNYKIPFYYEEVTRTNDTDIDELKDKKP